VGTSKHRLFQQQKSKQLNVMLLKEKLRLEILVKEKKLREAKDVLRKDAGSDIKAGNVTTTENLPLQLIANAPGTAFEHDETLTPVHERGVHEDEIHANKLSKFIETVTANASVQVLPDPCISAHTTLQATFPTKQIDTHPNLPITHGASLSPSYVGGILQTQTEVEVGNDALPLIQARKQDHFPLLQLDEDDIIRSRCEKAAQVGINVHTHKARKLL
jgi:hypothetical protein